MTEKPSWLQTANRMNEAVRGSREELVEQKEPLLTEPNAAHGLLRWQQEPPPMLRADS